MILFNNYLVSIVYNPYIHDFILIKMKTHIHGLYIYIYMSCHVKRNVVHLMSYLHGYLKLH